MTKLRTLRSTLATLDTRQGSALPTSVGYTDDRRGTTTARGYGWAWQQARERVLKRDCYQCQECKRRGWLTAATEVDHIVEKIDGGSDDDSNLQSLCGPCHDEKTEAEKARRRAGLPAGLPALLAPESPHAGAKAAEAPGGWDEFRGRDAT